VKRLLPIGFTRNILVPGWIILVGLAFLNARPLGAAASLSVFVVGVLVIPVLVLLTGAVAVKMRALASTRTQIARIWRRVSRRRR
jgi:hypothetical protein